MARGGIKGNVGGKRGRSGRKTKAAELGLKELLDEAWPYEQRLKWFRALAKRAAEGDFVSGQYLGNYFYGKPQETHNLQGDLAIRIIDESSE